MSQLVLQDLLHPGADGAPLRGDGRATLLRPAPARVRRSGGAKDLTLALAGGGVDATPPEVFLRCTPNYETDRAEILHSLWGNILCATFGKKILTGSCQVTEL